MAESGHRPLLFTPPSLQVLRGIPDDVCDETTIVAVAGADGEAFSRPASRSSARKPRATSAGPCAPGGKKAPRQARTNNVVAKAAADARRDAHIAAAVRLGRLQERAQQLEAAVTRQSALEAERQKLLEALAAERRLRRLSEHELSRELAEVDCSVQIAQAHVDSCRQRQRHLLQTAGCNETSTRGALQPLPCLPESSWVACPPNNAEYGAEQSAHGGQSEEQHAAALQEAEGGHIQEELRLGGILPEVEDHYYLRHAAMSVSSSEEDGDEVAALDRALRGTLSRLLPSGASTLSWAHGARKPETSGLTMPEVARHLSAAVGIQYVEYTAAESQEERTRIDRERQSMELAEAETRLAEVYDRMLMRRALNYEVFSCNSMLHQELVKLEVASHKTESLFRFDQLEKARRTISRNTISRATILYHLPRATRLFKQHGDEARNSSHAPRLVEWMHGKRQTTSPGKRISSPERKSSLGHRKSLTGQEQIQDPAESQAKSPDDYASSGTHSTRRSVASTKGSLIGRASAIDIRDQASAEHDYAVQAQNRDHEASQQKQDHEASVKRKSVAQGQNKQEHEASAKRSSDVQDQNKQNHEEGVKRSSVVQGQKKQERYGSAKPANDIHGQKKQDPEASVKQNNDDHIVDEQELTEAVDAEKAVKWAEMYTTAAEKVRVLPQLRRLCELHRQRRERALEVSNLWTRLAPLHAKQARSPQGHRLIAVQTRSTRVRHVLQRLVEAAKTGLAKVEQYVSLVEVNVSSGLQHRQDWLSLAQKAMCKSNGSVLWSLAAALWTISAFVCAELEEVPLQLTPTKNVTRYGVRRPCDWEDVEGRASAPEPHRGQVAQAVVFAMNANRKQLEMAAVEVTPAPPVEIPDSPLPSFTELSQGSLSPCRRQTAPASTGEWRGPVAPPVKKSGLDITPPAAEAESSVQIIPVTGADGADDAIHRQAVVSDLKSADAWVVLKDLAHIMRPATAQNRVEKSLRRLDLLKRNQEEQVKLAEARAEKQEAARRRYLARRDLANADVKRARAHKAASEAKEKAMAKEAEEEEARRRNLTYEALMKSREAAAAAKSSNQVPQQVPWSSSTKPAETKPRESLRRSTTFGGIAGRPGQMQPQSQNDDDDGFGDTDLFRQTSAPASSSPTAAHGLEKDLPEQRQQERGSISKGRTGPYPVAPLEKRQTRESGRESIGSRRFSLYV